HRTFSHYLDRSLFGDGLVGVGRRAAAVCKSPGSRPGPAVRWWFVLYAGCFVLRLRPQTFPSRHLACVRSCRIRVPLLCCDDLAPPQGVSLLKAQFRRVYAPKTQLMGCAFPRLRLICNLEVA